MGLIVFDLDGTLVDSTRDIVTAVNELRRARGHEPLPPEIVAESIGHGVRHLLERSLDVEPAELDEAVEQYLPIYRRHLVDTTRPYPGVLEALGLLAPEHALAVLTNKPRREAWELLAALGLSRFFRFVRGGDSYPRRKPDPMGVAALMEAAKTVAGATLLVGDSPVDLETARNASVGFVLVSYGLGSAEARCLGPDRVVDDLRELLPIAASLP